LEDDADLLSEVSYFKVAQVDAIKSNITRGRVIKAAQEFNQGGFARAVFPN